jgi:hypothetical protein
MWFSCSVQITRWQLPKTNFRESRKFPPQRVMRVREYMLRKGGIDNNTEECARRVTEFAVTGMELYEELPTKFLGGHIGQQLLRAGTAVAANYAEVRGAESRTPGREKSKPRVTRKDF